MTNFRRQFFTWVMLRLVFLSAKVSSFTVTGSEGGGGGAWRNGEFDK